MSGMNSFASSLGEGLYYLQSALNLTFFVRSCGTVGGTEVHVDPCYPALSCIGVLNNCVEHIPVRIPLLCPRLVEDPRLIIVVECPIQVFYDARRRPCCPALLPAYAIDQQGVHMTCLGPCRTLNSAQPEHSCLVCGAALTDALVGIRNQHAVHHNMLSAHLGSLRHMQSDLAHWSRHSPRCSRFHNCSMLLLCVIAVKTEKRLSSHCSYPVHQSVIKARRAKFCSSVLCRHCADAMPAVPKLSAFQMLVTVDKYCSEQVRETSARRLLFADRSFLL